MRITQNALYNAMRNHIFRNTGDLLRAQEVVATQKRINRLSDHPVDGGRVLDLKSAISRSTQHSKNIERMLSLTDVQDSSLEQAHDYLTRVKELLIKETNEATSTTDTREAARIEVAILTSQVVQVGNTQYDGQYIYSGFQTDTPAFADTSVGAAADPGNTGTAFVAAQRVADGTQVDFHDYEIRFTAANQFDIVDTTTGATIQSALSYTSGDPIQFNGLEVTIADGAVGPAVGDVFTVTTTPAGVYQGDGQLQEIEIQNGSKVQQNIAGDKIFNGVGIAGGVDIFDLMNRINVALAENDQPAMALMLDELDVAREQVSRQRSEVGARVNLLETVSERHADIQTNLEILRSNLEDIDVADAITQLNKQQNTYEATLGAAGKVIQPSLLDFLR